MADTKQTFRPALYYPYVHIRSEDWLKATLLCIPVVKRLIPDDYDPEDNVQIKPYTKLKGPYGELLQRVPAYTPAAELAQLNLLNKITRDITTIRSSYSRSSAPQVDEYWIHDAKFSKTLLEYLEQENLAWRSFDPNAYGQRNWYALHPTLGKAIMTCIGLSTAHERSFDIVTADGKYHEALLATDEDAIFEALLRPGKSREQKIAPETRRDLGQLVIALAGVNLKALPAERIPELQTSDKFATFRNTLRQSASTIDKDTDPDDFDRQLNAEAEKIVDAWRDAVNEVERDLREAVFEGTALGAEVVKTLVKGPEVFELLIISGLGLWRLKEKVQRYASRRKVGHQFLSQIHQAESTTLQLQYPLGI